MSFVRRLFGGRGDGGDDPDVTVTDPGGDSARPSELGPRTYLEFVGGSAAKFYAAVIEQDPGGTWRVSFRFGRIGFPRAWAHKVEGVDEPKARRVHGDLIGEKLRKGYEVRPWPPSLTLPSGERVGESSEASTASVRGIYIASVVGHLPTDAASVANVDLPPGIIGPNRSLSPTPTSPGLLE